jgi:CRP-like cAMP-binding protein
MDLKTKTNEDCFRDESKHCIECLRSSILFSSISDKDFTCFHEAAQSRFYKKGKLLFLEQEPAEFFYIICYGWIKLFHTLPDGTEAIVDMLTRGHVVGFGALFENRLHTSNAQAAEDIHLLCIPLGLLEDQMRHSPTLTYSMLAGVSRIYRRHCTELALNSVRRVPQRVGSFLLRFCPEGKDGGITFELPFDKTLIAHTLGMTRGSFSRALNTLRHKTAVRIIGNRVEIDSVQQLEHFVHGPLTANGGNE